MRQQASSPAAVPSSVSDGGACSPGCSSEQLAPPSGTASDTRLVALTEHAPASELAGGGPKLGIRWRRVLAGVFLGAACATKWNGVWYLVAFGGLAIAWDIGARRALGYRDRLGGVLRSDLKWLPVSFGVVPFLTYFVSWTGWFASSEGY